MKKNLFSYFGLAVCVITVLLLLTIPSCSDNGGGTRPSLPDAGMSTALFGYSTNNSYFFIQHVTEQGMKEEMYSGNWKNTYIPMTSFTMADGRQFIMGHRKTGYWFIQEILKTGDLGFETDSGHWEFYYETLSAWRAGPDGRTFIYGASPTHDGRTYWFIQEILPGGKLGSETDNGHWSRWYETGFVIPGDGDPAMLFGQLKSDGYWWLNHITPDGKMGDEVSNGHWKFYETMTSFVVGGESYLFGQKESGWWFIQDLPGGTMGGETDSGSWEFYYDTAAPFSVNGKTFLFLQKKSTGYWNIMEVLPGGKMGSQVGNDGHWHHYYNFVFPMVVDSDYLSTANWMTDNFDLIGDRSLQDIAITGSHDAGMSKTQECNMGNECDTQTQISNFYDQLNHGTRFFDLRPAWLNDEKSGVSGWFTGHWANSSIGWVGCMGQSLNDALLDIKEYLVIMNGIDPNHKELVIVNFSHGYSIEHKTHVCLDETVTDQCYGWTGEACSDDQWKKMIDKSLEDLSEFMLDVPTNCGGYPSHILSCSYEYLMQGGGHVIFLVDHDTIPTGYAKGVVNVADFRIYNDYSNTNSFSDMRSDQFFKLRTEQKERELFLLSWTLTLSTDQAKGCYFGGDDHHPSIIDLAVNADNNLMRDIMLWVKEGYFNDSFITKTYFPNILYVDRFGPFATRAAIYLNKNYANLKP